MNSRFNPDTLYNHMIGVIQDQGLNSIFVGLSITLARPEFQALAAAHPELTRPQSRDMIRVTHRHAQPDGEVV